MNVDANSGLLWYKIVEDTRDKQYAQFDKDPQYKLAVKHITEKASKLTDVEALMDDYRSLQVVLSAFQLEDSIDSRAMIKKIMTEDLSDSKSLVNRLVEPRYAKLATAMQPLANGEDPFNTDPNFLPSIIESFKTNEFEKSQEEHNSGVREAMYFKRMVEGAESVGQIMSDKVLMKVVRVGLGLPESFQSLEYDQQRERLEVSMRKAGFFSEEDPEKLDFSDETKLNKFIDKFLIMNDIETGVAGTDPILQLFGGGSSSSSGGGLVNLLV